VNNARVTEIGAINAFIAVAEQRNFTRAAKALGVSPASLSMTIRTLEERLGVRLLNRTTRSVAPTEAGESLLLRLRPVIDDYHAAFDSLNVFRDTPAGLLRIAVVPSAAESVVAPILPKFMTQYPDIRLEVFIDSAGVDIVAQHFDAGIRYVNNVDRDMIAVQVSEEQRWVVVGSRRYFERHDKPNSPQELHTHDCIRIRLANGVLLPWRFEKGGKAIDVPRFARPQRQIADYAGAGRRPRPRLSAGSLCCGSHRGRAPHPGAPRLDASRTPSVPVLSEPAADSGGPEGPDRLPAPGSTQSTAQVMII